MTERPLIAPNPPGLAGVRYRPARHPEVKAAMLKALSDARRPGLHPLGARDDTDLTIALIDAFATVADSVGFYVERSAREAWLRTAEERLSIRLLARLVGYELRPAIAASTLLAFEFENAKDSPARLELEPGLQAQSIPGPGELPQTFETVEPLVARPIWNAILPRLTAPQDADPDKPDAAARVRWSEGAGFDIRPGAAVVHIHGENGVTSLAAHEKRFTQRVARVVTERDRGRTRIEFEAPQTAGPQISAVAYGYVSLPMWVGGGSWSGAYVYGWVDLYQSAQFVSPPAPPPADPNGPGVYVMDVAAPLFAHDRPPNTKSGGLIAIKTGGLVAAATQLASAASAGDDAAGFTVDGPSDSSGITLGSENDERDPVHIHLDRVYETIAAGSWIVISTGTRQAAARIQSRVDLSHQAYQVTRRVTRLAIRRADLKGADGGTVDLDDFPIAQTTVHAAPRLLPMIALPIADPIGRAAPGDGDDTIELDALYLDLEPGKRVIVAGKLSENEADLAGVDFAEARIILDNDRTGARSRLRLDRPLDRQYRRDTVRLHANVALATHGESSVEPIASGTDIAPFRPIALKKKPLTFTPAATESGGATTLEIWVDGLRWTEVADFAAAGPEDRVYVTRTSEEGVTSVLFGDGATGALPASRTENVVARYRVGAGSAGRVKAGAISLLKSRPQGMKAVVNPIAAAGGADGEAAEDARANAPLKALTLGRVVSLQDYEDAARAFGPVAKARADWVWAGQRRAVFLTVAGEDGAPLAGSTVVGDLATLLKQSGDPYVPLTIADHRPALFTLAARVALTSGRRFEDVRAAVDEALRAAFGFHARGFGEAVTRSEILAAMQGVDGVSHIDLDLLHRVGSPATNLPVLLSAAPRPGERGAVVPAELLILTPEPLALEAMA